MADINTTTKESRQRVGVAKMKKSRTNIDLTPMVDLGFLLITFFIFTTSMSQPTAMKLRMPHDPIDKKDSMQTPASGALSILMAGDDRLYYYFGMLSKDPGTIIPTDYKEIRRIIIEKKRNTDPADFMILLRSSNKASYKNTVDILDEMFVNDVKRYALLDWDSDLSSLE
ncbi:MAG TPA: biopolymer transporter ExbD [Flavitalea sp.]|nr:biopolymer transporter ExbD [Flavitalea sp.]